MHFNIIYIILSFVCDIYACIILIIFFIIISCTRVFFYTVRISYTLMTIPNSQKENSD